MAKQSETLTALADAFANWHRLAKEAEEGKENTRRALLASKRAMFKCSDGTTLHVVQQVRNGWNMEAVQAVLAKMRGLDMETLKTCVTFPTLRISRPSAAPATDTAQSA